MGNPGARPQPARVIAWALWDAGSAGMNAIVVTFVFSVYLTSTVGAEHPGATVSASWLGRAMTIAGLVVAVLAPGIGVFVEAPHRRRAALTALTALAVGLTAAMSQIRADPAYLLAGLALLAAAAACGDLAGVPYNAMLRQVSTPATAGRVSGFGWATGYAGAVVLLLVVYVCFFAGDGDTRGLLALSTAGGHNVRMAMLLAAAWFAVFAMPLLVGAHHLIPATPDPATSTVPPRLGLLAGYRKLAADLRAEWHRDRHLVYFLLASAVYRDGLVGVFAFGAVLGVNVYGISSADVLLFGGAASVVAAIGAVAGGLLDDRVGSKPIIVGSLAAMIVVGLILLASSGPAVFWVCGLVLCLFIGPTQSASRTLLLRMAGEGLEGVAFGLYTMTGRAVTFLAPWLFSVFVDVFASERAGLGGLCAVLAAGLVAMSAVRTPGLNRPPRTP